MVDQVRFYDAYGLKYTESQAEFHAGEPDMCRQIMRRVFSEHVAGGWVADVGCGPGTDLPVWLELGAEFVVGVEPSATMFDQARKVKRGLEPNALLTRGSWESIPGEKELACIVGRYSLHLANLPLAFAEAARRLVPNGWLIFAVPHPDYHAQLVREGRQDASGVLWSPLFDGAISVPNPVHTDMEDYLGPARQWFDSFEVVAYRESAVLPGQRDTPTGMVCACRRKSV